MLDSASLLLRARGEGSLLTPLAAEKARAQRAAQLEGLTKHAKILSLEKDLANAAKQAQGWAMKERELAEELANPKCADEEGDEDGGHEADNEM